MRVIRRRELMQAHAFLSPVFPRAPLTDALEAFEEASA